MKAIWIKSATAVLTAVALAGPAAAATTNITLTKQSSGVYAGNFALVTKGSFNDVYTFDTSSAGQVTFTLTASYNGGTVSPSFSSVTFDGTPLSGTVSSTHERYVISDAPVKAGLQTIDLIGSGHGGPGGQIEFLPTVSAAPEPAAWMLMILGLGGVGLVLRRLKRPIGPTLNVA